MINLIILCKRKILHLTYILYREARVLLYRRSTRIQFNTNEYHRCTGEAGGGGAAADAGREKLGVTPAPWSPTPSSSCSSVEMAVFVSVLNISCRERVGRQSMSKSTGLKLLSRLASNSAVPVSGPPPLPMTFKYFNVLLWCSPGTRLRRPPVFKWFQDMLTYIKSIIYIKELHKKACKHPESSVHTIYIYLRKIKALFFCNMAAKSAPASWVILLSDKLRQQYNNSK